MGEGKLRSRGEGELTSRGVRGERGGGVLNPPTSPEAASQPLSLGHGGHKYCEGGGKGGSLEVVIVALISGGMEITEEGREREGARGSDGDTRAEREEVATSPSRQRVEENDERNM